MKRITFILAATLMFGSAAMAQRPQVAKKGDGPLVIDARMQQKHKKGHDMQEPESREVVKIISAESARVGETIGIDFYINYDALVIQRNEQFVITPVLMNGGNALEMRPVVFVGENCYNKQERSGNLYGESDGQMDPYRTVVMTRQDLREKRREKRDLPASLEVYTANAVRYEADFPFEPWMHGAQLVLMHEVGGCKHGSNYDYMTSVGTLYNPLQPQVVFVEPEVETVKARSDKMTARVVFRQSHSDIDLNIADNAQEIKMIDNFTDKVFHNEDVSVTGVKLVGYASPEGSYSFNEKLSKKRVETLANEVARKYNIPSSKVQISNVAEDWDSVSRWVAKSDLRHKREVLDIISTTQNPDARDAKIRALDNGATYSTLMNQVYPQLRRTEYSIQYTVQPFTVEKGMVAMRNNPQHLSLHEFYQIANTYDMDSPEYMDVYTTAVRYFPEDMVANNNMAAIYLNKGDRENARRHLAKCEGYDKALNNMGVLEAMEGNYDQAERYFRQAARNGSAEAQYNLANLETFSFNF